MNNVLNFCVLYFSAKLSESVGNIITVNTVHSLNLFRVKYLVDTSSGCGHI